MMQKSFSEIENMNTSEYKQFHESFMKDNDGSTALHTYFCLFFTVQCIVFCSIGFRRPTLQQYVLEFLLIVLPLTAVHTVLSDYIALLNIIAFILLLCKCVLNYPSIHIVRLLRKMNSFEARKIHSLTLMRAVTYLVTVLCILAVDFQCFPRHLAKTERFGHSVMDTGVGFFVLISGVVHKNLKEEKLSTILKGNVKLITILTCLGVLRFWSVKQLDYQEHVTEYGVHWNFFFTIAVCKLVSTVILFFCSHALLLSILTKIVHEFLLWSCIQNWVFDDEPRTTLLSANREGISSSLGYISMYLFAAHFKTVISDNTNTRFRILFKMLVGCVLLAVASNVVHFYAPTSRTLANAGYCLFMEMTFLSFVTFMYFIEILFQDVENKLYFDPPLILSAINRNGLLYFLIANLMTGIINLSIRTLLVSTSVAILIIVVYMALSIALIVFLVKKGIKI